MKQGEKKTRKGFTIIEVMLVLAVTGLLLIGVLGRTYSSIATQRYNDSVRSFAEFLRQNYAEVISPETLGFGNSDNEAIYGKVLVFGLDHEGENDIKSGQTTPVYTATMIGDVHVPNNSASFVSELKTVHARLFCGKKESANGTLESTVTTYTPLWEAHLRETVSEKNGNLDSSGMTKPFSGTVIIARLPSTGLVHTAYSEELFNLRDDCTEDNNAASVKFADAIQGELTVAGDATQYVKFDSTEDIGFCIESDNSNVVREVRIKADGRNTSAINTLTEEESRCRR